MISVRAEQRGGARLACIMPTKRVLGQRLRSNLSNSAYSSALDSSITRSARKLKMTTASPVRGGAAQCRVKTAATTHCAWQLSMRAHARVHPRT